MLLSSSGKFAQSRSYLFKRVLGAHTNGIVEKSSHFGDGETTRVEAQVFDVENIEVVDNTERDEEENRGHHDAAQLFQIEAEIAGRTDLVEAAVKTSAPGARTPRQWRGYGARGLLRALRQ